MKIDRCSAAFEQAGIDLLDISGGLSSYINPNSSEQGYFSDLTAALKQKVTIPVLLTGGILDAEVAEELLGEEKADMIGVGLYNIEGFRVGKAGDVDAGKLD